MKTVILILLTLMILCALSVVLSKSLMTSIIIYMGFSMFLSIIWFVLQAPDLGITEAAVGAGVDTILFFAALRKVRQIRNDAAAGKDKKEAKEDLV